MAEQTQSLTASAKQLLAFTRSLTVRQKVLFSAIAVLVAGALATFVAMAAKPDMKLLYSGGQPADAQAITARLAAKNIAFQIAPDGSTVNVPADQLDSARLEIASEPMPHNGRLGFEIFDKPNWTASDFNEQVNYQRALEGELERTLQTLDGVGGVRVHLVMPKDSLFTEQERSAKATVVLKLTRGKLSTSAQSAIARLVAGSVDKLDPDDVTVIDGDTNRALNLNSDPLLGMTSDGKSADDVLAARLITTLEAVTGAGRARASVRLDYDNSSSEENQETYDPQSTVALTLHKTEERSGGPAVGGVVGASSNLPGAASQTRLASEESQSRSENGTYAVNRKVRHTVQPAGRLKRITAALLIDDDITYANENGQQVEKRVHRSPEQLRQIEQLANAVLGIDATRGDVLTVQNISFQSDPVSSAPLVTKLERVRKLATDFSGVLKIAGLILAFLLAYALVIRPLKQQLVFSMRAPQLTGGVQVVHPEVPALDIHRKSEATIEIDLPESSSEMKKISALTKQLTEKVKAEPIGSTRLIQTWIREGAE